MSWSPTSGLEGTCGWLRVFCGSQGTKIWEPLKIVTEFTQSYLVIILEFDVCSIETDAMSVGCVCWEDFSMYTSYGYHCTGIQWHWSAIGF